MNFLLVTNFFLDEPRLAKHFAAYHLIQAKTETTSHLAVNWGNFTQMQAELESQASFYQNMGSLIVYPSKSKEDLSSNLLNYFISKKEQSFLYLGSLSEFSLSMQQGLLRFIEEPPKNLNIILTVRSKKEVLNTILSRCQTKFLPLGVAKEYANRELLETVSTHLPDPKVFIGDTIKGKQTTIPDLKTTGREALDAWLWQVEYCLAQLFLKNSTHQGLKKLMENTLKAQKLNAANVLNRLVWAQLFIGF